MQHFLHKYSPSSHRTRVFEKVRVSGTGVFMALMKADAGKKLQKDKMEWRMRPKCEHASGRGKHGEEKYILRSCFEFRACLNFAQPYFEGCFREYFPVIMRSVARYREKSSEIFFRK